MGNCIGKKSNIHRKQHRYSSTRSISSIQRPLKQTASSYLLSNSNTSLERRNIFLSNLSNIKQTDDIKFNDNDKIERKVIQYSTPILLSTNDQCICIHTPSILSHVQLSNECKKLKSSNTMIVFSENHIKKPFILMTNEQDTTMGHLFSTENDINKENDNSITNEKMNIDIKVHRDDDIQTKNQQQYFTRINEKNLSDRDIIMVNNTQEIVEKSIDTSPSPTLFDSSLSSLSCNTTPFSSQDRLIHSSCSSSSSSAVISPLLSTAIVPQPPSSHLTKPNTLINFHGSRSLNYSEQIYLNNQSSLDLFLSNKTFPSLLPVLSSSRSHNDLFINEFHQNIQSYNCKILRTVIDNVTQQQFIRIHQSSKVILIEHKQLECVHLKDVKKFDTPSLIFDEQQKLIYLTKHARFLGLQSLIYTTNNITRLSKLLSSCDQCSTLLSGSKLYDRLYPFILVNTTHNLVQMCFNETNNNSIFGYISQKNPEKIRQTIINNSKFSYSYDLDVHHISYYFVIRVHSWPHEFKQIYEQRQRLWPNNIDQLFDGTCFIRISKYEENNSTTRNKCTSCEKILSFSNDSIWSYTYTAIESQLISLMSDEQIRFASILWNYLNGKTQGELPFNIYKHTLFYFFEKYSSDCFQSNDLLNYGHIFTDFLFQCLQQKSLPHYFNSNSNLYNDNLSTTLMSSISIKMTYLDLKHFSIYHLSKTSLYLYYFIYLIQFQSNFFQSLLSSTSTKSNSIQTILDTHEYVIKQFLSGGIQIYKQKIDTNMSIKTHRTLTLDCLYRYQEENVQIILDYLPLLRDKEPSLIIHSLWSMFIQYFNCLFDDLFIS